MWQNWYPIHQVHVLQVFGLVGVGVVALIVLTSLGTHTLVDQRRHRRQTRELFERQVQELVNETTEFLRNEA